MNNDDFDSSFRLYYERLFLFARKFVSDEQDCYDIVSSAFEQLWNNVGEVQASQVRQYLFIVVRNRCIDHLRHRGHRQQYIEFLKRLTDEVDNRDELAERDEREHLMQHALSRLDSQSRQILQQCLLHGKRYHEVASEMGLSLSSVKKYMARALKIIRKV